MASSDSAGQVGKADLTSFTAKYKEDDYAGNLKERYNADIIYTRIGPQTLISVNPYKQVPANTARPEAYSLQAVAQTEPYPHVYELAANALVHLMCEKESQAIVASGESGAGKTEAIKAALKHLLLISKKDEATNVDGDLYNSLGLLELFGHARSSANVNSSRFGKYVEMQYNANGELSGAKIIDYGLERHRVISVKGNEERNFHIFYSMLAGMPSEDKATLKLGSDSPAKYAYLKSGQTNSVSGVDDAKNFKALKNFMKSLGISKKLQSQIFRILAAILHLGNIEFGQDNYKKDEGAYVKTKEVLENVAELLGCPTSDLEAVLTTQLNVIGDTFCSDFLSVEQSLVARDHMASTLYGLLFSWLVDYVNNRLSDDNPNKFISLVDLFGVDTASNNNGFTQFCVNYCCEKIQFFMKSRVWELSEFLKVEANRTDLPNIDVDPARIQFFELKPGGYLSFLDAQSNKPKNLGTDAAVNESVAKHYSGSKIIVAKSSSFTVSHYFGKVTYDSNGFVAKNSNAITSNLVRLFRNPDLIGSPTAGLVAILFSDQRIDVQTDAKHSNTVVKAATHVTLKRKPTMGKRSSTSSNVPRSPSVHSPAQQLPPAAAQTETEEIIINSATFVSSLKESMNDLVASIDSIRVWSVYCLKPNDDNLPGKFSTSRIKEQLQSFAIKDLVGVYRGLHTVMYDPTTFINRYSKALLAGKKMDKEADTPIHQCQKLLADIPTTRYTITLNYVMLSHMLWKELEVKVDKMLKPEAQRILNAPLDISFALEVSKPASSSTPASSKSKKPRRASDLERGPATPKTPNVPAPIPEPESDSDSDSSEKDAKKAKAEAKRLAKERKKADREAQKKKWQSLSKQRRWWLRFTTCSTWWIPECCLVKVGRMKRDEVRLAWREKVALCVMILILSGLMVFFVQGLSYVLCPTKAMLTVEELKTHTTQWDRWMAWHGNVYDVTFFNHPALDADNGKPNNMTIDETLGRLYGKDVSAYFPRYDSEGYLPEACYENPNVVAGDDINLKFRTAAIAGSCRPNANFGSKCHHEDTSAIQRRIQDGNKDIGIKKMGVLAHSVFDVRSNAAVEAGGWIQYNGIVYALGPLYRVQLKLDGSTLGDLAYLETLKGYLGSDINELPPTLKTKTERLIKCFNQAFKVGEIDSRNSVACQISSNLLLVATGIVVSVMVFKFLTAIFMIGSKRIPQAIEKYIIMQVPCYTEGEESLKKTMNSLSLTNYDDMKKLLFIICDGMVKGSGNDKPTPDIVLEILGIDPDVPKEALSYVAIGDGSKQHNKGKIYAGFYQLQGRQIPYIAVVKVGTETETSRPGNRGKRDSQMILMKFLNKVHYQSAMTPMELEIYRQIVDTVGVDPLMYEYCLMVDADTEVLPDSMIRLVTSCLNDIKIMGICGETLIANERKSWVTAIQVYEYYISHHLAKAFESLFGSVTCLPGCFCMYRVRCPARHTPLLISNDIIQEYSDNKVDTLHKKNLLSLGEDRYLTTLMMKYFPDYRTKFTPDAKCKTIVPDDFGVLLSQRRRWTNSTIHNMFELVFLPQLCGCLCFSMRFVIILDLFATLVMPASVGYLFYMIARAIEKGEMETIAIIMISAAYGIQALVFILKGQFQHIGWMIVSLIAIPVFNLALPLYAFWHFDDFSWGNTRRIVGAGSGDHSGDGEEFDVSIIPSEKWEVFDSKLSKATGKKPSAATVNETHNIDRTTKMKIRKDPVGYRLSMMDLPPPQARQRVSPTRATFIRSNNTAESTTMRTAGPSDDEIAFQIRVIILASDLSTMTKKMVREKLNTYFETDLSDRKEFINKEIEAVVASVKAANAQK